MSLDQWQALSHRIRAFTQAGQQLFQFDDSYGTIRRFGEHGLKILIALEHFRDAFRHSLPQAAVDAIDNCVSKDADISVRKLLQSTDSTSDLKKHQVWAALAMLMNFEIEMTYILSDAQVAIRVRVERALLHLKRLIVVDAAIREQWKDALKDGEVACEKRGAVHLLWHGIWAFKVNGEGERTDLVFQQRADELPNNQRYVERYADGLVLTEWKVASSEAEAQKQFAAARIQAGRYAKGVLAGSELAAIRYLVVVTPHCITEPPDWPDRKEGVVYRHINIVADPTTPSKTRVSRTRTPRAKAREQHMQRPPKRNPHDG
jgi:hypothetical protein